MKLKKGLYTSSGELLSMKPFNSVIETPWASRTLGMATFEIKSLTEEVLKELVKRPGHFTLKVPLKRSL